MAESEADCIFCKILRGELPGEVVQEDEHTVAFMDINPWTRGHAVVIPRNHSKNLYEVPDEDLERTMVAAKRLALRMRDTLGCDGVNLLNSCEPATACVTAGFGPDTGGNLSSARQPPSSRASAASCSSSACCGRVGSSSGSSS